MLILHYPLTNGLEDISSNNNNLIYINDSGHLSESIEGKIGKCQERKTYNTTDAYRSSNKITLSNDFTMCCWAYVVQCNQNTANGLVTNHNHNTNSGAGITVKWITDSDFRISCNTGSGAGRTYHSYYGTTNIKDKWHHLVVRYNKGTEKLDLLVDGKMEYTRTYSMYSPEDYLDIFNWSTGHVGNVGYRPTCKLNDIRIYDNALSDKEIYDIAQAKILHYKFNHQKRGNIISDNLDYNSYSPYHDLIQEGRYVKCIRQVGSTSSTLTINAVGLYLTAKTIRVSGKMSINGKPVTVNGLSTYQSSPDHIINNSKTGFFNITQTCDHINNNWIFHKSFGAEIGDVTEIFDLVIEELSTGGTGISETIEDSSSFNNDAILDHNAPSWTYDSKLGSGAYYFNGANKIETRQLFFNSNQEWTSCGWVKIDDINQAGYQFFDNLNLGNRIIHSNRRPLAYGNSGLNDHYVYGSPFTQSQQWTHIAYVYNFSIKRLQFYVNGKLDATSVNFESGDLPAGFNSVTRFFENFTGVADDVRIYATALSDNDILKLYQSRFNIDDKGNFSLNELNTVEDSNSFNDDEYNLVTNGNTQLKDNTNFSGFTYIDNVDGEGFEDDTSYTTGFTDEFIEFDFRDYKKECDISFAMKNTSNNGQEHRNYSGISCYDKHRNRINYNYVNYYSNTETTLAQDLNNGDTIAYLTSALNWKTSIDASTTRSLGIHNLPDYPPYTYTNKIYSFDTSETITNTVTLSSPYSGSTVVSGTKVANQFDGGNYQYITSSNALLVDGQEVTYSATFNHSTLRYGTKYFKPLMLLNRNVHTGLPYKTLIKDITVEGRYGDFEKDKKVSFQENGVYSSNVDEVGMTEGLVGYWNFNGLEDYSNEQNDLRDFGVGLSSGIATFDGVSSLTVPNNTSLNLDYVTTVQVIKIDGSKIGENIIVCKESSYETRVNIGTDSAIYQTAIMVSGLWSWIGDQSIPLNEWVFVATVWNGQTISNYVNDSKREFANRDNLTGSISHSTYGFGIGTRMIPANGSAKGQSFFKGDMQESRIYNRILTEDEILTLYKTMMKKTANIKDNVLYVNEIEEV